MSGPASSRRFMVLIAIVVGLVAVLAACAGPTRFIDPEADIAFYERVGIIPFKPLAQDRLSGEKVADAFFTELISTGFARVVEPGQFAAAMSKARGAGSAGKPWSTDELARLGEETGVQGIFMGTVVEYSMVGVGRDFYPILSLELRLVDAVTGRIVWSASHTRRGGPALPLFGWTEKRTMGGLVAEVCRDLLKTLPRQ